MNGFDYDESVAVNDEGLRDFNDATRHQRPRGLGGAETMSEVKRYKVTGRGPFPVDMLRYDRVSPSSEADSYAMGCEIGADHGTRTVEVMGRGCTPARWLSFLWAVVVDEDQV